MDLAFVAKKIRSKRIAAEDVLQQAPFGFDITKDIDRLSSSRRIEQADAVGKIRLEVEQDVGPHPFSGVHGGLWLHLDPDPLVVDLPQNFEMIPGLRLFRGHAE